MQYNKSWYCRFGIIQKYCIVGNNQLHVKFDVGVSIRRGQFVVKEIKM